MDNIAMKFLEKAKRPGISPQLKSALEAQARLIDQLQKESPLKGK